MTNRLANAIAEDPNGALVVDNKRAPGADILAEKIARLDAAERLAVERVVDLILESRPAREGGGHA